MQETLLYIAQEALANAARHSGARRIEVTLAARDGGIELRVADDGRGFEPGEARGMRLQIAAERHGRSAPSSTCTAVGDAAASPAEIRAAATAAGAGGLMDVPVAGLSAGERRRVALARAFLRRGGLMLLDEPTAGLDSVTEERVLDATRRLLDGRRALLVAHRPAVVGLAGRRVRLESGRLLEVAR